jgi:hypothetical protein
VKTLNFRTQWIDITKTAQYSVFFSLFSIFFFFQREKMSRYPAMKGLVEDGQVLKVAPGSS